MTTRRILLTCEHAGNHVPDRFAHLFRRRPAVLESHRGYDPGAAQLAASFATHTRAPLYRCFVTRLLVETNRSPGHPQLFSAWTRSLDRELRQLLLRKYYAPYRRRIEERAASWLRRGARVLHLAVHTFTPRMNGAPRRADVGLLYDPASSYERAFCRQWQARLRSHRPQLVVRRNYPYRGQSDGFPTFLRRRFGTRDYAGIELEVSQRWHKAPRAQWRALRHDLVSSFADTCRELREHA